MRRIDENTCIDDSLVSCAEYQLFIDEMHETGKCYQPDHWTSYQFPSGKGKEPILGVRHSDAVTFCAWLTQREHNNWRYRMATKTEAKKYLIKPNRVSSPLGYWTANTNDQIPFMWINPILDNPRMVDPKLVHELNRIRNLELSYKHEYECELAEERERIGSLDRVLGQDRNRALDYLDISRKHAYHRHDFNRTYVRVLDLINRDLDHVLNLVCDHGVLSPKDHNNFNYEPARGIALAQARDQVSACVLDRALDLWLDIKLDLNRAFSRTSVLDLDRYFDHARISNSDRDLILDLYIDIFMLQKRIDGRSLAFEGIRFVKERIK